MFFIGDIFIGEKNSNFDIFYFSFLPTSCIEIKLKTTIDVMN